MATPAAALNDTAAPDRAAINRQNAQHSTGPRTPDGKSRVRLNAFKHGLHSQVLVLPWEDETAFKALGESLTAHFRPQTPEQTALVQTLQETRWKLDRIAALEINLHTFGAQQHLDAVEAHYGPLDDDHLRYALAQVAAFQTNARLFDQLGRHESRLLRLQAATTKELLALLTGGEPIPDSTPAPSPSVERKPGFVPFVFPEPMPKFTGPMADIKKKQWLRRQAKQDLSL